MIAGMTSFGEIFAWVMLAFLCIGGVVGATMNWSEIRDWFRSRRIQRARMWGYRHRSARLEFDNLRFGTVEERKAYREGWDERGRLEDDLAADELGMIVAEPPSSAGERRKRIRGR